MSDDELVYAIDLRRDALGDVERDLRSGDRTSPPAPPSPARPLRFVALLVDGRDEPVLLPIAPTRDGRFLDALARLIRVAVVLQQPVPEVARLYGAPYEQDLVARGLLPEWASGPELLSIAAGSPSWLR